MLQVICYVNKTCNPILKEYIPPKSISLIEIWLSIFIIVSKYCCIVLYCGTAKLYAVTKKLRILQGIDYILWWQYKMIKWYCKICTYCIRITIIKMIKSVKYFFDYRWLMANVIWIFCYMVTISEINEWIHNW